MTARGRIPRWILSALLGIAIAVPVCAQAEPGTPGIPGAQIDLDAARSRDEFRWGVGAFHEGRFSDAIVAFVRALSFKPENALSREWLGRTYYHSGLVDAALSEWDSISATSGAYLLGQIDTIRYRRGILPLQPDPVAYALSTVLRAVPADVRIFQRPIALAPSPDGSVYISSLAGQEILKVDPNGRIQATLSGGLAGLDKPFDILRLPDGDILVAEFGADRITRLSPQGMRVSSFGTTGLGDGELLGPQYLTVDDVYSVFVSEWGGRRISKFDANGAYLLSIGRSGPGFSGIVQPTGVQWFEDALWVADNRGTGTVLHRFDGSGNFLETIRLELDDGIEIEDIEVDRYGRFLLSARETVLIYDPRNQVIVSAIDDGSRKRITSAVDDANGRIAVGDFDADEVVMFTPEGALYSGLDVRIHRIVTRSYPTIGIELSVLDRAGRPILGLSAENFLISEKSIPQEEITMDSAGFSATGLDMALVFDSSVADRSDGIPSATEALRNIFGSLSESETLRVYVTEDEPQRLLERPSTLERYVAETGGHLESMQKSGSTLVRHPERTIHLAAAELTNRGLRRHVVFVSDGALPETAFDRYSLEELAWFMKNNGITFSLLLLSPGSPAPGLDYLVNQTGGQSRYLYEPDGLASFVPALRTQPNGKYWLVYRSRVDTDFGRAYIPVAVEARLEIRSGRDELGFFGPAR